MKTKLIFGITYIIEAILLLFVVFKVGNFPVWISLIGLIILIIIGTIKLDRSIHDWVCYIKKWNDPELTFKQFYSLYSIMPEKFQLNRFDVTYRSKDISFKTYIDFYKYMKFFEHYKEQKKEKKRTEIQANLIKELQQDLAAKQEENDQWVKKNVHIEQTSI